MSCGNLFDISVISEVDVGRISDLSRTRCLKELHVLPMVRRSVANAGRLTLGILVVKTMQENRAMECHF